MIVVDASVPAPALADDGPDGDRRRERLRGEVLTAPEVIDLEVASVLRQAAIVGRLPERRERLALIQSDPDRSDAESSSSES